MSRIIIEKISSFKVSYKVLFKNLEKWWKIYDIIIIISRESQCKEKQEVTKKQEDTVGSFQRLLFFNLQL